MKWIRYRFTTKAEDYRPLIFNPKYPWWCSGFNDESSTIVAYLPQEEHLHEFWDDADDITQEDCDKIEFSSRFPRPDYFKEEAAPETNGDGV